MTDRANIAHSAAAQMLRARPVRARQPATVANACRAVRRGAHRCRNYPCIRDVNTPPLMPKHGISSRRRRTIIDAKPIVDRPYLGILTTPTGMVVSPARKAVRIFRGIRKGPLLATNPR